MIAAALLCCFFMLYASCMGLLTDNTPWWPLGRRLVVGWPLLEMFYWLMVAGLLAGTLALLVGLPPPPRWSCVLALTALGLHVLVDFDLHAGGVAGTCVVVALLAGGKVACRTNAGAGVAGPRSLLEWLPATGLAISGLVLTGWWLSVAVRESEAVEIASLGEHWLGASDRDTREQLLERLAQHAGDALEEEARPAEVMSASLDRAAALAPWDYPLRLRLLSLRPPGMQREERLAELAGLYPSSAALERMWAEDERAAGQLHHDAGLHHLAEITHLRQAIALDPNDLHFQRSLVDALERAAGVAASDRERQAMQHEAQTLRSRIKTLEPQVYWNNR